MTAIARLQGLLLQAAASTSGGGGDDGSVDARTFEAVLLRGFGDRLPRGAVARLVAGMHLAALPGGVDVLDFIAALTQLAAAPT